ncbi:MAG: glycosyltransferase [Kiritimatiellae bacterium]|nr:glycosyltransferase [Kiritimatiellia bacterium]MDD4341709.1 glycosyltransferase [Kiritimatiellia bacterium]
MAEATARMLGSDTAAPQQQKGSALWRRAWRWGLRHAVGTTHWNRWQHHTRRRQGMAWLQRTMTESTKPVLIYVVPHDIWKLRSGGGQRIAGIAKTLSRHFNVLVFTLTRRGPGFAVRELADACHLVAVPMGAEYIKRTQALEADTGLFACADFFDWLPDFQRILEVAATHAKAWGFTHPTAWPVVRRYIRPACAVFYDAHDDYSQFIQQAYGSEAPFLSQRLVELECDVLEHVTVAAYCTESDLAAAQSRLARDKKPHMLVVPNGVDVAACQQVLPSQARQNRISAGIDRPLVLFIGAHHKPNYEAVAFISRELAPAFPHAIFVIMGMNWAAVCQREQLTPPPNVVFTSPVPETIKEAVMALAEVAIAPMTSGTGSSLKVPDYIAHGKVVISTAIGLRGFAELTSYPSVRMTDDVPAALADVLAKLEQDPHAFDQDAQAARAGIAKTLEWSAAAQPLVEAVRQAIGNS